MSIKQEVKVMLARRGLTMKKLIELLNEKYDRKDSIQNLSNKLNNNTIKYREVEEIAGILNFEIVFKQESI